MFVSHSSFGEALRETARYLRLVARALRFWRRPPPVANMAELIDFVDTRSKYITQTALYGYIRTRTGTRFASMMEDDLFAKSVNIAKWEIYLACLSDLALYAAATLGARSESKLENLGRLATLLVEGATAREPVPPERPDGFADAVEAFQARLAAADWDRLATAEGAFTKSPDALVEWAPIADELKVHDVEIIKNSVTFRWKKVRDELAALLEPESVLADWRARSG